LRLLLHCMRAAASRTFCTAGSSRPMRMAMMAMTTSSSISVKPLWVRRRVMGPPVMREKEITSGVRRLLAQLDVVLIGSRNHLEDQLLRVGAFGGVGVVQGHRDAVLADVRPVVIPVGAEGVVPVRVGAPRARLAGLAVLVEALHRVEREHRLLDGLAVA